MRPIPRIFAHTCRFQLILLFFIGLGGMNESAAQAFRMVRTGSGPTVRIGSETLQLPWMGGLTSSQIAEMDVNGDGTTDLLVFDKTENHLMVVLRTRLPSGEVVHAPAPEYADLFPPIWYWMVFGDLEGDGDPDLFTSSNGGVRVYENIGSVGQPMFRLRASNLETMWDFGFRAGMLVLNSDLPGIADLDGDGDLDIISFDNFDIGKATFYRNMSVERYGRRDSLDFLVVSRCWGRFEENQNNSSIQIGLTGSCFPPLPVPGVLARPLHMGSTITPINADGDSLVDILLGDVESRFLKYLRNSGSRDTARITQVFDSFPAYDIVSDVPSFCAGFLVDVDLDGRKDLLVAPGDYYYSRLKNHLWHYKNQSANARDSFRLQRTNYLTGDQIHFGTGSAPLVADIDGDGHPELLVSHESTLQYGVIHLYKNTGSALLPIWEAQDTLFLRTDTLSLRRIRMASGDLNGDGKADLLLGHEDGPLHLYRNESVGPGSFAFSLQSTAFGPTDAGPAVAPELYDLNADGKNDLILGTRDGRLRLYLNQGSSLTPQFTLTAPEWGGVNTTEFFTGYAVPRVTDLNRNGQPDLVVGSERGRLFFYPDVSLQAGAIWTESPRSIYSSIRGTTDSTRLGRFVCPAPAHLDGDSLPDLLVGSFRGGLMTLHNQGASLGSEPPRANLSVVDIQLIPNPALSGVSTLVWNPERVPSGKHAIRLTDATGKTLYSDYFDGSEGRHPLSLGGEGLRWVEVQWNDGRISRSRLLLRW